MILYEESLTEAFFQNIDVVTINKMIKRKHLATFWILSDLQVSTLSIFHTAEKNKQ